LLLGFRDRFTSNRLMILVRWQVKQLAKKSEEHKRDGFPEL